MSAWAGGGLTARRLDRAEIHRRMDGQAEAWVVDELLDVLEPAAALARAEAERLAKPMDGRGEKPKPAARRGRARRAPSSDEGDES